MPFLKETSLDPALEYVVKPAFALSREEFIANMFAELQRDGVFFKATTGKSRNITLCVCAEGVLLLDKEGAKTMIGFHHFKCISDFIAPPTGRDAESYAVDPAGYRVQLDSGERRTLLFRFEKPQERHLFLNIVNRRAAECADVKRNPVVYRDKTASPGLCDATTGVVSAIRTRRARDRADSMSSSPSKRTLRFNKEEQLIESAIEKKRTFTM